MTSIHILAPNAVRPALEAIRTGLSVLSFLRALCVSQGFTVSTRGYSLSLTNTSHYSLMSPGLLQSDIQVDGVTTVNFIERLEGYAVDAETQGAWIADDRFTDVASI